MDSNSALNNLHCTTVFVSYIKLAVGQELVTVHFTFRRTALLHHTFSVL